TLRIVEAVAPWIAQPDAPDLRRAGDPSAADERIVRRDLVAVRMRVGHVDVNAQHLAEKLVGILRAIARIVPRSSVAQAASAIAVVAPHQAPAAGIPR